MASVSKKYPQIKADLRAGERELQDLNPRSSTLEADALPTVLNSHALVFRMFWTGLVYPSGTLFCWLLGFAVHLVDAAARAILVELQTIWMFALVFGGCVSSLFALGAGEGYDNPCFICHDRLLYL